MKINTIMAFDLGTNTGVAYRPIGTKTSFVDVLNFSHNRYEGGGMRYLKFQDWLNGRNPADIEAIYFEEVRRHLGTDAAHVYGGLLAVLTAWCEKNKIPYEGIPVGTIKKHATGKGNANKDMVLAAAREKLDYTGDSYDAADALWLLEYVFVTRKAARNDH